MPLAKQTLVIAICLAFLSGSWISAQDWPQWRGKNRDAVAVNFKMPESWPTSLNKKWSVDVGDGVATPSIQGDKLYVMAYQDGNEVMRCLNADNGEEIWADDYPAEAASGPARGFPGTRSSPSVAEGYVVTIGVNGTVSCWDAGSGELVWRNDDYKGQIPRFSTSSSPLVAEGICVVQFGGERSGGIAAHELKSGNEKWKWTGAGAAYGSPVMMTIDGTTTLLAPTGESLVMLELSSGKKLWDMEYRQGQYNAATPVVDGGTVIFAGPERGMTAISFTRDGDQISAEDKWRNEDSNVTALFNSPVLLNGMLFGLSNGNNLFCVKAENGETQWYHPIAGESEGEQADNQSGRGGDRREGAARGGDQQREGARGGQRQRGQRGRRGGRGGGGRGGYGSVVSAGSVLIALSPSAELVVFEPDSQEFKELARYKVSESQTYAYPVLVGDRIYIKDNNTVSLWTLN